MRWEDIGGEPCSVARALSVVGERWTLLVLRNCFLGQRRFEDLQKSLGVTRHILADRLRKLVAHGVLRKERYQERPARDEYRLTEKGLALWPVLVSLAGWGDRWMGEGKGVPLVYVHRSCGHEGPPQTTCEGCGEALDARAMDVKPGPGLAPYVGHPEVVERWSGVLERMESRHTQGKVERGREERKA